MTFSNRQWAFVDPQTGRTQSGVPEVINRRLMRRLHLVDKAKQAAIVGLLVGTLGGASDRAAVTRLRQLARAAGKHTYTVLMGKPTPQKLANFLEVRTGGGTFRCMTSHAAQTLCCLDNA